MNAFLCILFPDIARGLSLRSYYTSKYMFAVGFEWLNAEQKRIFFKYTFVSSFFFLSYLPHKEQKKSRLITDNIRGYSFSSFPSWK